MYLFCATEAGGARELRPVILESRSKGMSSIILSSPATTPIFAQVSIDACDKNISSLEEAREFFQKHSINLLVTGTTGDICSERYLIAVARELGIPSMAILDEWYNYGLRFQNENGDMVYLPDVICVQDQLSFEFAKEEGIPVEKLRITGSPSLFELSTQVRLFEEHPPDRPVMMKKDDERLMLLFLSERLGEAYGTEAGGKGSHGEYLGFYEGNVRCDLADALSALQQDVIVIEKLHPSEGMKPAPSHAKNVEWRVESGAHPIWPLLWYADCIIGMCTKALLEAAMLGRNAISYQPNAVRPELCTAARLGLVDLYTSKEQLVKDLPVILTGANRIRPSCQLPCADSQAVGTILAVADELLKS